MIDFGLADQLAVLERLGLRGSGPGLRRAGAWLLGGLLLVGAGAWAWRRFGRGGRGRARPETVLLERVLGALAGRGLACAPSESPQRLLARLREGDGPRLDPAVLAQLAELVATYEALRFGPSPPADALPRLRDQARALLRALRRGPRPPAQPRSSSEPTTRPS